VNNWHYIAWHTPDEWYTHHNAELVATVKENGRKPIVCRVYEDTGGWIKNGMMIPHFIMSQLQETTDDLVYLDSDARVRQYPELFDTIQEDLAFHVKDGHETLIGTVFIKNTPKAIPFVERWIELQAIRYPHILSAQVAFEDAVRQGGMSVYHLPANYTQIFDTMAHHGKPVIEHMQASRKAHEHNSDGIDWKRR